MVEKALSSQSYGKLTDRYAHDALDQLTSYVGYDGYQQQFTYDANGMRLSKKETGDTSRSTLEELLRGNIAGLPEIVVQQAQDDAAQSGAVLDYVSGCMGRHENAHCYALEAGDAQLAEAHEAGLSCGKYHVYQELLAYDPSLTAEEVQQMTMRELRDLLAQYQGEAATDAGANGAQQGQGAGNGQGYGARNGSGQGRHGAGHGGHHGQNHE